MKINRTRNSRAPSLIFVGSIIVMGLGYLSIPAHAVESPLTLGTSSTYGVLASSAVTSATPSGITGTAGTDIGVGGATAPTGTITTAGTQVLGGASLAALTAASNALADNRGGTVTVVELGAGRTITPGAYTGGTLEINGTLTLDAGGASNSVFIFRASSTLITGVSSNVVLTNGAQACNVFWQVGSSATLGGSSSISGHVIAQASISTGASSTVNGQLVAVTGAVTLGGTTIVNNNCTTPTPAATSAGIPTPVQTSQITGCTLGATADATAGGVLLINGNFTTLVTGISVSGVMVPQSLWTQTSSLVTLKMPPHAAGAVTVALYNGQAPLLGSCQFTYIATPAAPLPVGTLHIVKKVVNSFGGVLNENSFNIHVTMDGLDIGGSPDTTLGGVGRTYILTPGSYILREDRVAGYRGLWSGPVSDGGSVDIVAGTTITVFRTNFDMNPASEIVPVVETPPVVTPTEDGGVLPATSSGWGNAAILSVGLITLGAIGLVMRKSPTNR